MPPDDKGGVLVEKAIIRKLGGESAAQFYAYLSSCWIFNRYGRNRNGGLINPTMPDPDSQRNEQGHLLHPETHDAIFNEKGKPVSDIYHPAAIRVLNRVDRDQASTYPVLPFPDLTRACFPDKRYKRMSKKHQWEYRRRSLAAWEALEQAGYIRINRDHPDGWQIVPSDRHISLHKAILDAAQKKNQHRG